MPYLINNYAIAVFRVFFVSMAIYVCVSVTWQLREDLAHKMASEHQELVAEMRQCQSEY